MNYKDIRQKYPVFIYDKFEVIKTGSDLKIQYTFLVGTEIRFTPFIIIKNVSNTQDVDVFAFNLGMVELLSYWKATFSPKIIIKAGYLDSTQITWWKKLYVNGMGQYFYENNIDFKENTFEIVIDSDKKFRPESSVSKKECLLAFSGGIDSTTSLEILSADGIDTGLFMMNPTLATKTIADNYKRLDQIIVERGIDPDLLNMNNNGFLNGHTPISAYLAFLSVMTAKIFEYKYVVFSNERSSNEPNVKFLGSDINHQYSKTYEFEVDFRDYLTSYLSSNIEYFSFLRPLYNIQITKLFAQLNTHFDQVKSCNVNQKSGTWCLTCPKCLSTFILIYPFISTEQMVKMFAGNIYMDITLFGLLEALVDENKVKPFECVGTRDELLMGLSLSNKKDGDIGLAPLLAKASQNILTTEAKQKLSVSEVLKSWNTNNQLPEKYARILRKEIQK